jgi:hypothetical protein
VPLLVVARAGPKFSAVRYSSSQVHVQVMSNYGQLKVTNRTTTEPVAGAYVKVFAKVGSGHRLYKDGFTDRRGRFDYVTLNTPDRISASMFAVLIQTDLGSEIRIVKPPLK